VLADRSAVAPRFSADRTRVFFGRPSPGAPPGSTLTDVFSLDLASGAETPLATQVDSYYEGLGPAGRPPPIFVYSPDAGSVVGGLSTLTIIEPDTGDRTVIDRVGGIFACCDSTVDPMVLFRNGGAFGAQNTMNGLIGGSLWVGTYKQLHQVANLIVSSYAYPEDSGVLVMAEPSSALAAPVAFGIVRVGYDGAVVETVVAPTLTKAEPIGGQALATALESSSLDESSPFYERCLPPVAATGAQPAASQRCFVTYRRRVGTMNAIRFVHFLDEDRELVVPHSESASGIARFDVLSTSPDHPELFMWIGDDVTGSPTLWTWNILTGDVSGCALAGNADDLMIWRSDRSAFAIAADQEDVNPYDPSRSGHILVKSMADGTCATLPGPQLSFDFAPQGTGMIALARSASPEMTDLALFDVPNAAARPLATVTSFWRTRFFDQNRVLVFRFATEGFGLSWLDVTEATPTEHPLAEQLMMDPMSIGPGRLLVGYDFSSQDETGTVSLFDLDAGTDTLLSRSVSDLGLAVFPVKDKPAEIPVAYIVKGRNPSGQDGIWLASVPTGVGP
jgi:hypothetical protein